MPVGKDGFYHIDEIMKQNAQYSIIFGKRSAGKTYSAQEYFFKNVYAKNPNAECVIIRRYDYHFDQKNTKSYWEGMVRDKIVEEVSGGKYNCVVYKAHAWYLGFYDEEKMSRRVSPKPFAHAMALNTWESKKSNFYDYAELCIFEEFLSPNGELPHEWGMFMNCVSTIVRCYNKCRFILLGNTVDFSSTYFRNLGMKRVEKMRPGDIKIFKMKDTKFVVEYTEKPTDKGKLDSDIYFPFDDADTRMITEGDWSLPYYPQLTKEMEFKRRDIVFEYFIKYDDYILHCEVINLPDGVFTYIHEKTTPIKKDDTDLVFSTEYSHKPNYKRRITNPTTKLGKKILKQFVDERVFYQDNYIGQIVRNYLLWCKNQKYA